ncbi:MAG: flagellar brake protein [Motiliproteus sp.]
MTVISDSSVAQNHAVHSPATRTNQCQFTDLQLQPGQVLQLELEGYQEEQRYRSSLLGYRIGHSLMVTAPAQNGLTVPGLLDTKLKARLFSNHLNGACAFESKVLHLARHPYPYLHLSMPDKLYLGEVRKSVRADVNIISSALHSDGLQSVKHTVCIIDLSTDGARITSKSLNADTGEQISLITKLKVSGVERIIQLTAIVRSVSSNNGKQLFGLQFIEMGESDRVMIHACVLSSLYKAPGAH